MLYIDKSMSSHIRWVSAFFFFIFSFPIESIVRNAARESSLFAHEHSTNMRWTVEARARAYGTCEFVIPIFIVICIISIEEEEKKNSAFNFINSIHSTNKLRCIQHVVCWTQRAVLFTKVLHLTHEPISKHMFLFTFSYIGMYKILMVKNIWFFLFQDCMWCVQWKETCGCAVHFCTQWRFRV